MEARHYVQYDQGAETRSKRRGRYLIEMILGEDRWLCTLLLQEGYRVEYCAASDALTYAPESFHVRLLREMRMATMTLVYLILGIFQPTSPLGAIYHRQYHRFSCGVQENCGRQR